MDPLFIPVIAIVTLGVVIVMNTFGVQLLSRLRHRELKVDSPRDSAELESVHDAITEMSGRLERLEEERDFYKNLLDSPQPRRELQPPALEEDPSDTGPA